MRLYGLLSFPLTPFTPDDEVATGVLADHVAEQVAAGPAALFVACGTGEFTALDLDETRPPRWRCSTCPPWSASRTAVVTWTR